MLQRHCRFGISATLALAVMVAPAAAQQYPQRPLRMLIPFAPGGPTDVVGRIIAQKLSDALGQQVVVDNRPGAAGNIAIGMVARAAADGYTLLMTSSAFVVNPALYPKSGIDPFKDFAPVSNTCVSPNIFYVHPSVPVKTVKEFAALAARDPGKLSISSPGMGTTPHLASELLKLTLKHSVPIVPFNGAAPAMQSTLGNQTPVALTALSPVIPHVKAGTLRALAVTSGKRSASLPEVPTMVEAGYPGQETETFQAVLLPAGTPPAIVKRLNAEIVKMFGQPDVRERITGMGLDILASSPEDFAAEIRREVARWKKVVKEANIKVE